MTDLDAEEIDPCLLDKQPFKKYVQTRRFINQPLGDKLNIAYCRLPYEKTRQLIEITRKYTLEEIIAGHTNEIHKIFDEVKLVTLNIETIVNLIKDFDDGL